MHNTYLGCLTIAQTKSTTSKMFKHNKSLIIKFTRDTKTINNHHKKGDSLCSIWFRDVCAFFSLFHFVLLCILFSPLPSSLSLWGFFCKCLTFEISLIHMHSNFNPTPKVKSINQSFVIFFPFFAQSVWTIAQQQQQQQQTTTTTATVRCFQYASTIAVSVCVCVQCMSCAYWILLSESHQE